PVYSHGHRNPEGLAFHPETGALYAVEHGPDAWDEVNLIEPATNYGWPAVVGPDHGNYRSPLRAYDPIIAPATADFYVGPIRQWDGSLFFGTLGFSDRSAGRHLHRIRFGPDGRTVVEEEVLFKGEYGRIRAVKTGPDGCLYFGTSNRDGRGDPAPEDDRILRACPR
ncbi:MAG TPA: PQQ-dependent sugar dehydrogenase, partial [Thermaerobacter sp.]